MPNKYAIPVTPAGARPVRTHAVPFVRFARRLRALVRLVARRRRTSRRVEDLRHLDERTLHDLGISRSEIASIVAEVSGRTAATRRRTDLEDWSSTASPLRIRAVDSSL